MVAAIAACGVVALLSACASIPLSTMWKMGDMTPERFFASDPRQMRVAVRTSDDVKRGSGLPQIRIDLDAPSTKPICYAFTLEPIDPRAFGEPPLDALPAHRRWHAFALSRAGIDAFERARREVRIKELKGATFSLEVTMTDTLNWPEAAKSVGFGIDLALTTKDGYFTLIKETDMAVTSPKNADKKPAVADAKAAPACVPTA
jgi:hypothetical protein